MPATTWMNLKNMLTEKVHFLLFYIYVCVYIYIYISLLYIKCRASQVAQW